MPTPVQIRTRRLTRWLLLAWAGVTLLPLWLAHCPQARIGDWPLDFWMAAQGCVVFYLALVVLYAWLVNRWERQAGSPATELPPPAQP